MANYLIFPMKVLTVTQNYSGSTSHRPHTTGKPCDYPIDIAGADTGRDWFYCPCDEVVIKKIYGVGAKGTNTMWIESTTKVDFADGTKDYCVMQITHPNDSDLRRLKVGQKFKRGEAICQEGIDGATGNHIHFSIAKGKMKGNGWTQNTNGKWVLTGTTGPIKPEDAMLVDESFTKYKNKGGIVWDVMPKKVNQKYVVKEALNIRNKAGIKGTNVIGSYKKGTKITITETKLATYKVGSSALVMWGHTSKGWVCLLFCDKVK